MHIYRQLEVFTEYVGYYIGQYWPDTHFYQGASEHCYVIGRSKGDKIFYGTTRYSVHRNYVGYRFWQLKKRNPSLMPLTSSPVILTTDQ